MATKTIGIVGARGHTGAELIKLIANHPQLALAFVSSRELDGQRLADHSDAYKGELTYTNLDPEAVAAQAADVVEDACMRMPSADRSRLAIRCDPVTVVWPRSVVSQAIGNVLRNAVQASASGDVIDVRVDAVASGDVRIAVTDRGHGMSAEDLARAGEPFFTTKAQGDGIGLGLFVTRATLGQLGGSLGLTSSPGNGTVACITLPANVVRSSVES